MSDQEQPHYVSPPAFRGGLKRGPGFAPHPTARLGGSVRTDLGGVTEHWANDVAPGLFDARTVHPASPVTPPGILTPMPGQTEAPWETAQRTIKELISAIEPLTPGERHILALQLKALLKRSQPIDQEPSDVADDNEDNEDNEEGTSPDPLEGLSDEEGGVIEVLDEDPAPKKKTSASSKRPRPASAPPQFGVPSFSPSPDTAVDDKFWKI